MNDLNEIFSRATQGDLDTEIAAAGELLQKVAAEQGVDLTELSDEDVAELMTDLMPQVQAEKVASAAVPATESIPAETVTYADVAVELSKVAAAKGVELASLSREDYHAAFDAVATDMASPEYGTQKQAEEEAESKLAEADAIGRYMARSFMDEQEKIAASWQGVKDVLKGGIAKAKNLAAKTPGTVGRTLRGGEMREKARAAKSVSGIERLTDRAKAYGLARAAEAAKSKSLGKKVLIGAGGAGVAGGTAAIALGAKRHHDKQAGIEAEALELARDYLLENGIDPDTGDKVASDAAAERAAEILAEAGWL